MKKIFSLFFCFVSTFLWAQQPGLVVPIGHTAAINSVSFSPDGKYIVTGSDDLIAKVWDKISGRLLYSLYGHKENIRSVVFSPDGSRIITASINDRARIWDAKTGLLISVMNDEAGINSGPVYSTDGRYILSVGSLSREHFEPFTANLWDANGDKLIYKFVHDDHVKAAAFSTDGEKIITASKDNSVKIWSALNGTQLADLKGHKDEVLHISFSQNGKLALTVSKDKTAKIWNADNGALITSIKENVPLQRGCFSPDGKLLVTVPAYPEISLGKAAMKIWDVPSGKLIFVLKKHKKEITDLVFIENGSKLLSSSYDGTVIMWDISTGKVINELAGDIAVSDIDVSGDGSTIITATSNVAKLWDAKTCQLSVTYQGDTYSVTNSEFSPNGKKILTATDGAYVRLWDPGQGKLEYVFQGGQGRLNGAHFSVDGEKILIASCNVAEIWDANNAKLLDQFKGFKSCVTSIELSPDGQKLLTTAFWDDIPKIWDIKTKSVLQLKGHDNKWGTDAIFSPDGKLVLTSTGTLGDKKVRLWDASTGKTLQILEGHNFGIRKAVFFPDGSKVITTADDNTAKVWDVNSGKLYYQLEGSIRVNSIEFSPDGKKLLITSDSLASVRDAESGQLLIQLKGHTNWISNALFFPDGNSILTVSSDGSVKIWDAATGTMIRTIELGNNTVFEKVSFGQGIFIAVRRSEIIIFSLITGKQLYSLISLREKDFIFKDTEGYYLANTDAAKLLHYVTPELKIISFEQLDVKYNRPDKVLEAIGSTDTALIRSYRKAWEKRIKKLGIDTTAFRSGYSVPEADFANRDNIIYDQTGAKLKLGIKSSDSTYKLDRFNVWINETPIYGKRGISLRNKNKNSFDSTVTIDLSQGENRIETSITNVNGTESYRMPLLVNYTPVDSQKTKTYFIGIGIDQFKDSKYNLRFSTKDIRDLSKKLKEKYNDIIIDTLFNEQVTISNVKALKQKLLQTSVNDKVIISYSGHGMLSKDFDYYLSTYAVNFDKPEENGLPYDELESLLDSIPARKKLMLIDACHSGEVDKEDLVAMNATDNKLIKGLKPVAYKKDGQLGLKNSFELMQSLFVNVGKSTGATIISAAAGTEFALEGIDNLPNGVFTYCILEAMNKYPTMKISELKKTVGERVVEITKGLQKPTSRNETIAVDWEVWSLIQE
ncbi:MAG: caspase family protein [Ferruginibacter sp.]